MEPITDVPHTYLVPDEALAQAVAAAANWMRDGNGAIFDQDGIYVGASLTEVAAAMRSMSWFTPERAEATGINWRELESIVEDDEQPNVTGKRPAYRRAGDLTRRAVVDVRQRNS